ncbi:hypothetical protein VN97_g11151 [Penicillium thymicola]|uniref:Uncharacterized protein n=2 Tax=Penicillium TaxID=5073 RepID=A0A0M8NZV6_9EURO|nr:hypothetical protein VN97_g11151 [Penicillium thymicola]KOS37741.1 hypothetical protein ACN38_g11452 [Penicillium nordicum]
MSRGQPLDPIYEEITPADHRILCLGGTSSNLERLQSRLQSAKQKSPDFKIQLEETAYEMGYLRAELQWHKETKQILLQFQETVFGIFGSLEDALARATARMHESEQQYLTLWGSDSRSGTGGCF